MLTRKERIWTAVVAICLIALVVMAANPTFNSFNPAQFTTTGDIISIQPGILGGSNTFLPQQLSTNAAGQVSITAGYRTTNSAIVGTTQYLPSGEEIGDGTGAQTGDGILWNPSTGNWYLSFLSYNDQLGSMFGAFWNGAVDFSGASSGTAGSTLSIVDITNAPWFGSNGPVSATIDTNGIRSTNNGVAQVGLNFVTGALLLQGGQVYPVAAGANVSFTLTGNVLTISAGTNSAVFTNVTYIQVTNFYAQIITNSILIVTNEEFVNILDATNFTVEQNITIKGNGTVQLLTVNALNYPLVGTGLAPNMAHGKATNFEGSSFAFTAPINVVTTNVNTMDIIVSNTSAGAITVTFPATWTNNWITNGLSANIPANSLLNFAVTVWPGLMTNVSWSSPPATLTLNFTTNNLNLAHTNGNAGVATFANYIGIAPPETVNVATILTSNYLSSSNIVLTFAQTNWTAGTSSTAVLVLPWNWTLSAGTNGHAYVCWNATGIALNGAVNTATSIGGAEIFTNTGNSTFGCLATASNNPTFFGVNPPVTFTASAGATGMTNSLVPASSTGTLWTVFGTVVFAD